MLGRPPGAGAATLEPCESTNPTGPIITLEGDLTLEPRQATRRALRLSGVRQVLVKPANGFTGRPVFPVGKVRYGKSPRISLKGGITLVRKKRRAPLRSLHVLSKPGKPAYLRARAGGRTITFLVVKGGKRKFVARKGQLSRIGAARLTAAGARYMNKRLRPARKLRAGTYWGTFNLFSIYKVTPVEDPTGEPPPVPPAKEKPAEAMDIAAEATIKWYVRDSFIDYVAAGDGTRVEDGATADPPEGQSGLSYSFNFPFTSGWAVPAQNLESQKALIKGSGLVGFRYCDNTINFTASDPEIEIDGDADSRIIFHVNGTDGTAYPDQRAVMVKLIPSQAVSKQVDDDEDTNLTTVTYERIPGFVPAEGTGIFADIYPAFSPDYDGLNPRPDRFGFISLTYTYPTDP
ncbi:MAG: HtaA domain-containing protein [Solirubrobacterales bacterium]|nr:HtaA domain-containing protein [Solirubrobacterales bacterium]